MGQRQSKEPGIKKHQQQQKQNRQPETPYKTSSSPPTTPTPAPRPKLDPPISEITRPRAPSTLTRLSSLLDPTSPVILSSSPTGSNNESGNSSTYCSGGWKDASSGTGTSSDSQKNPLTIRSPSGNLLGIASYFERPDRPLSMRERQERVRRAMERAQGGESQLDNDVDEFGRLVGKKGTLKGGGLESDSHKKKKKSRGWCRFDRRSKWCCFC